MAATVTNYVLYGMYAVEGLAISIGSGLLLGAIVMEKALRHRKEMRIIAALCIADLVYGFAGFIMNVYRVLLMAFGLSLIESSSWDCIKYPHTFLQNVGQQLVAYMNLAVSIDRFLSVTFPVRYFKFGSRYATGMIAAFFIYFGGALTAMLVSTYLSTPYTIFNMLCLGAPFAPWFVLYHYTFVPVCGALQVITYIGVFFVYRSRMKPTQITSSNNVENDQRTVAQRRLTVTLGLITISTIFFFIAPASAQSFFYFSKIPMPPTLNIALAMLCRVSAILNIIIYVFRQKEVRPGMWKIVTCNRKKTNIQDFALGPVSGRTAIKSSH